MAAPKKFNRTKIVTPKGTAIYPRLGTPDTKFNADGIYSTRLRLTAEAAAPLVAQIDKLAEDAFAAEKARLIAGDGKDKAKAKALKLADKSYKSTVDDEGNETGDIEFNFKMKAQYTDRKTQEVVKRAPRVVDSKGRPVKGSTVWGGSQVKVGGYLDPFVSPNPKIGVGVSLKLAQVAVYELVSGGDTFDFGNEEGYEAPDEDEAAAPAVSTDAASADTDGEPDEF